MNDPNRKIDVNLSSLLSLKAELLRKQTEVNQAKSRQANQPFVPKSFERQPQPTAKGGTESHSVKQKVIELEDNEQLEKSRRVLEAKSKFYDRMTAAGGAVNSDDNCLVLFNAKKQTDKVQESSSDESDSDSEVIGPTAPTDDGDWVEYTDGLGRTRKCLRIDLEFFKKRDDTLMRELGEDKVPDSRKIEGEDEKSEDVASEKGTDSGEESEEDELLKAGRQIQQMREQWDMKEAENKDKEFVHYQDVLFDEARTHGVGYFQFSTDSEERLKQQKELELRRKATLDAQKERDEQRAAREKIIAERVLAAKNRQRARLGLPPLEKIEEPTSENKTEDENAEKEKQKDDEEAAREMERKSHLRPWDVGKEGTSHLVPATEEKEWTYKNHKEPMSQEQWNEMKREERVSEFAPTSLLNKSGEKRKKNKNKREKNRDQNTESVYESKAEEKEVEPEVPMDDLMEEVEEEKPGLYFTTKKKLKRRNYQPEVEEEKEDELRPPGTGGVQVPPPPTFDYYGPPILGLNKRAKAAPNLETSIEAGLKFLRNQTDKGQSTSKSSWGAKANYGRDV